MIRIDSSFLDFDSLLCLAVKSKLTEASVFSTNLDDRRGREGDAGLDEARGEWGLGLRASWFKRSPTVRRATRPETKAGWARSEGAEQVRSKSRETKPK